MTIYAPQAIPAISLQPGINQTVVTSASGTGTDDSTPFAIPVQPGKAMPRLVLAQANPDTVTVLKGHLQSRINDDEDWSDYSPDNSIDLVAFDPSGMDIDAGIQYRIKIDTITATSVDIVASLG